MTLAFARFSDWASRVLGAPLSVALHVLAFAAYNAATWQWPDLVAIGTLYLSEWTHFIALLVLASTIRAGIAEHAKLDTVVAAVPGADKRVIGSEDPEKAARRFGV